MSSSAVLSSVRWLRGLLAAQHRMDDSDEQLLDAFLAKRDANAFAVLLHRHGPMVLRVCRRVLGHQQDAEDAFQAVFLVLARNASGLRNKKSLVSWLYGTAYRTALRAQQSAARRRKHEARTSSPSPADPMVELSWREVRTLLDEEIARLPEKYQSVFILCCLEEMSRAEAARRLGMKEAALVKRLATARKRLRDRLARRGVELTVMLAAVTVATPSASALPAGLMATTVKAALAMIADGSTALSPSIAALVQTGSPMLSFGRIKLGLLILLTVATSGSFVCWYGLASGPFAATAEPPGAQTEDKAKPLLPPQPAAKEVQIHGLVLGPQGLPKAGAKLYFLRGIDKIHRLGDTGADGTFALALPKGAKGGWLIAQAKGSGIDFRSVSIKGANNPIELRLVKDQVIRGRVLSTEGKPIRGVRVFAETIRVFANNSLDAFLSQWKRHPFLSVRPEGIRVLWSSRLGEIVGASTDADGRFALHGVGVERFVRLRLRGACIADSEQLVANRSCLDPKPYNQATIDFDLRYLLQEPELNIVADPAKAAIWAIFASNGNRNIYCSTWRRPGTIRR